MPIASYDQKTHVAPHFDHLHLRNVMMSLMTASASLDANVSAYNITHDQKGHVALHLNCLNLRNAILSLMMLPASCDIDVSTNSVT